MRDPDIDGQAMTPRGALVELAESGWTVAMPGRIELVDRPTPLQSQTLDALCVDTSTWNRTAIA